MRVLVIVQFAFQVWPPSREKHCCQYVDPGSTSRPSGGPTGTIVSWRAFPDIFCQGRSNDRAPAPITVSSRATSLATASRPAAV